MLYLLIFIFGAVIGSFLNVVIIRIHEGGNIVKSRSSCPHCHHVLEPIDLIPIFIFIIQAGKCRYCHKKISWQYPLVELTTGLLFVLATYNIIGPLSFDNLFYNSSVFLIWLRNLIFISFLVVIFVYDLRWYLILDRITFSAMAVALILNLIIGFSFFNLFTGAIIGFGFFALQFFISKGSWIGGGDLRLGALMGLMLGAKAVIVALFFSYIIGAVISILFVIGGKKKLKSQIPFGTFLAIGTIIALFWGQGIINWYLSWF
ncbi:MAG: prepilin peptidase [Candidatus Buchananbacteria bacterium]|nr:prepilin peptidase [Candidatus Buchananbacteria bacterium]